MRRCCRVLRRRPRRGRRKLVALAGAPGAGKSTLAEALAVRLSNAAVLPMDGFHLDNRLLKPMGLLPRKGAPETFDADGFCACLSRVAQEAEVIAPLFDRAREIAIAGAARIGPEVEVVIALHNHHLNLRPDSRARDRHRRCGANRAGG